MKIHNVTQGSPEWHALRANHYTASEAPAMLGLSKYQTRAELLRQKATGIAKEVDAATQRRFDAGHAAEAAARSWAEGFIGEELYPATGTEEIDGLPLLASFDGLTMDWSVNWENKLWNEEFAEMVRDGIAPDTHWPQMEQQMLVSGAGKVLFTVSDGGEKTVSMWYESIPERRAMVIAGWKQFAEDLASYQHVEPKAEVIGKAPESLPALRIELTGMVTASNLVEFRQTAMALVGAVNTDLQTDQDFANAEKAVTWCKEVEERLEAAKQHALSQTASIDELFRTVDEIKEEYRQKRLGLDKLVKARKESRRTEIVSGAQGRMRAHVDALNKRLGKPYMPTPDIGRFAAAIKGLKSFDSMQDKVDTELAKTKIEASETADKIEINLNTLREMAANHAFLFADTAQLVMKANDDLTAIIKSRIAEHEAAEAQKRAADEERIRAEERARVERENLAKSVLEQEAPQGLAPGAPEAVQGRSGVVPEMAKMPEKKAPFAMAHRRGPDEVAVNMGGQVFALTNEEAESLRNFLDAALKQEAA